jgi:GNAT superfamily N-acetyltransferase
MERRFRYCPAMRPDFEILPAMAGDAERLRAVMCRGFAGYRGRLQPESSVFAETAAQIAAKLAGGGGRLAWQGDAVLGCVIAERLARGSGRVGYIGRLAVDPAARGHGLGGRLVAAAEDFLRGQAMVHAEVHVRIALPENIAFFARRGYQETARGTHPGFAHPTYLVMTRPL